MAHRKKDDVGKMLLGSCMDNLAGSSLLDAVLSCVRDYIYIFDLEGRFVFANKMLLNLWGLTAEQALGKTMRDLDYPGDVEFHLLQGIHRVIETGKPFKNETCYTGTDGRAGIFENILAPVFGPDGRVALIAGSSRDMTSHKKAEDEIQSLARFPRENPNPVLRVSTEGALLYANPAAEILLDELGWRKDMPLPDIFLRHVNDVNKNNTVRRFELLCPSRRTFLFDVSPGGVVGNANFYAYDITEQKSAAEALRRSREDLNRAQAVAHTGSWRLDIRENKLIWSDENHRIFGIPQNAPLTYETFLSTVHPDDREYVNEKWNAALRGEPYDIEHRIIVENKVRWVREIAYLEFDAQGSLQAGFGVTQEITDRRRAEQALRQVRDDLERRVRERTAELDAKNIELANRTEQLARLASEVTLAEERERHRLAHILHDHLQQLLAAAKMELNILKRDIPNPEHQPAFERVIDLLSESIRESRSLTVELSPPLLHEAGLIAGLGWLEHWMHDKHGLSVLMDLCPDADTTRDEISILVFQSVRELLFNTAKHSGVKEARVILRKDSGGNLCVRVLDSGRGFDVDRMWSGVAQAAGGFGLFSIRERILLLGGVFDIDSRPGRGVEFALTIPLPSGAADKKVTARSLPSAESVPVASCVPASDSRPLRIILADDHAVMRRGLASLMKLESDIEIVAEAENGIEAVELTRELRPDAVIMDVSMPEMNGIEAARIIHDEFPEIRVIALSMYNETDRAAAMFDAGACAYATKSESSDVLLSIIRGAFSDPALDESRQSDFLRRDRD